ncbi:hypothetical protein J2Z42_002605 [Clostridium algifaecis]|uniref:Uncharacterized protein n=1 Tax=Clostridium algifaecis TaxID=1472040 RepID=A0ABS4KV40_9CLOT|nr:hypothetical protein [Clostridium algifaecis]
MIVPTILKNTIGASNMWMVFLPAIIGGIFAMKFTTALSDRGFYVLVYLF